VRLQEPLLQVLRDSSSGLVRDLAAAMDSSRGLGQREVLAAEQGCQELNHLLGVLGNGRVDLHFVKCLLPNRESKTCQEEGCFDWQAVLSSCIGHGVFEIGQLQRQSSQYMYRRTHSEFLSQFGALTLGFWREVREDPKTAIEKILQKEVPVSLGNKTAKVGSELVLLTVACLEKLKDRQREAEAGLTSVAALVQQAARGHNAGAQAAESRGRLLKL